MVSNKTKTRNIIWHHRMKTNKIIYVCRNSKSQQTKTDTKPQRHLHKTFINKIL